jgi:hypothetical protein
MGNQTVGRPIDRVRTELNAEFRTDPTVERHAHQCTWTYQHRRCPEMIDLHVHEAATPDGQDRTLCDRHERELQASEHRRFARSKPDPLRVA